MARTEMKWNHNIVIVGDTFPNSANVDYFVSGDASALFDDKIRALFSNADFTVCNLEGALTDNDERCNKIGPVIVAPTKAIEAYKRLGVDCCTLANNHVTDGGHQGVIDTISTLDKAGIIHIGAGINETEINHSLIRTIGNFKLGLYNVCELMFNKPSEHKGGAWLYDEYVVCREISELRQRCDYLVVIYHGGIEKFQYPSPEIRKRFHRMADNGADMILSQHTHCIGCEEWYNDAYLLYGQGNFLFGNEHFGNNQPGLTDEGFLIEIKISDGRFEIIKHLVRNEQNTYVCYEDNQDFTSFNDRSEKVNDNAFIHQQFQQFCRGKLPRFLKACKSLSVPTRIVRKLILLISKKDILTKLFELNSLYTIYYFLRSEQKREEAITGMEVLLGDFISGRKEVNW